MIFDWGYGFELILNKDMILFIFMLFKKQVQIYCKNWDITYLKEICVIDNNKSVI